MIFYWSTLVSNIQYDELGRLNLNFIFQELIFISRTLVRQMQHLCTSTEAVQDLTIAAIAEEIDQLCSTEVIYFFSSRDHC